DQGCAGGGDRLKHSPSIAPWALLKDATYFFITRQMLLEALWPASNILDAASKTCQEAYFIVFYDKQCIFIVYQ
ncbi:MAG: hypothetical protein RIQ89_1243, partial [Bacteroidota bacterium]